MERRDLLKSLAFGVGVHWGARHLAAWSIAEQPTPESPPGIFCNQLGYLPGAAKVATVRIPPGSSSEFTVRSAHELKIVFQGVLSPSRADPLSGDSVQPADFSLLQRPGSYVIECGNIRSDPLRIDKRVYADALRLTMRGFTGQRCGCAVDLGDGYKHPACHLNGLYGSTSGLNGSLPNHGGWHDAGDYGRYIVNSGITCGTLLWAWELQPAVLKNLRLDFPKQHANLPDYLEELLWNLNWMLQLQDSDGGVFHKQTSRQFCAFVMPQDDSMPSEIIGIGTSPFKSTAATADFAAVMAVAARCYRTYDAPLATTFLSAAERAWKWSIEHPDVAFSNPPGIATGAYGDRHCEDELAWASAELWRTTGEPQYEKQFLAALGDSHRAGTVVAPSWSFVLPMALWTYALSSRQGDPKVKESIRARTFEAAAKLIQQSKANGYGNTLSEENYTWGSNGTAANQSLLLLIADRMHANPEARLTAFNNLHYLLGRNCFGTSWVTQLGSRPFLHPHHRPSAADGIEKPWPGLLSGGPNRRPADPAAGKLPKLPPMRMWLDDQAAYSMNEVAINWNAPLVFLLAFANAAQATNRT